MDLNLISRRTDLAVFLSCLVLGATAFSLGTAYACDTRGREVREEWELEVIESVVEGEPRLRYGVEVGDSDRLYSRGPDNHRVVLEIVGLAFERN